MERVAVFVDAGYLFAAGTKELFGEQLKREDVSLNYVAVEEKLRLAAEEHSKLDLLRIYWYDGAYLHPTTQHTELARLSNVKVRLGLINSRGEQKGVDSLIVTDMITLARNRAMDSCMLLTGDEDIRVGVLLAQEYGVRVHLLGIKPAKSNQSNLLRQEADVIHVWESSDLRIFLSKSSSPESGELNQERDLLRAVAQEVVDSVSGERASELKIKDGWLPPDIDGHLLSKARKVTGNELDRDEKRRIRKYFRELLKERG